MELLSKEQIIRRAISLKQYKEYDNTQGVYFLINRKEIIYIGRTKNLMLRLIAHKSSSVKNFNKFSFEEIPSTEVRFEKELSYIKYFKPEHNINSVASKYFNEDTVEVYKRLLPSRKIKAIAKKHNFGWQTLWKVISGLSPYDIECKERKAMIAEAKDIAYKTAVEAYNVIFPSSDLAKIDVIYEEINPPPSSQSPRSSGC